MSDSTTIDQQFVEYIVKSLVGNPDAVKIERRIDEKGVLLELTVDAEDLGRVIGKRGATAQSLRTLLRALGTKNDARYNLKIVDNGEGGHGYRSDDRASIDSTTSDEARNDPPRSNDDSRTNHDLDDLRDADDIPASGASDTSDAVSRTRQELADLDDLDV